MVFGIFGLTQLNIFDSEKESGFGGSHFMCDLRLLGVHC